MWDLLGIFKNYYKRNSGLYGRTKKVQESIDVIVAGEPNRLSNIHSDDLNLF